MRAALGDTLIPVAGALCFLDADWPMIGGSFTVDDVQIVWPRLLVQRMTRAATHSIDVDEIHTRLADAFPRA